MTPEEYLAEAAWLFQAGLNAQYVCTTIGVDPRTLERAAHRAKNSFISQSVQEYAAALRREYRENRANRS